MSVRNMLKVMMSLLLAVTLAAATTAHAARLDQSFASVAEETLQVKAKTENSGLIPYNECIKTCSKCACTKIWPPEINMCSCLDDNKHKKAAVVADRLDQSFASVKEETLKVTEKSENSGFIPYAECVETCSQCACTKLWPPEINMCSCLDDSVPKNTTIVADHLDQPIASFIEKVNVLYKKLDLLVGPVPKRTRGDDKKMVLWTTSKMEAIPYKECIKTCNTCVCPPIGPSIAAMCICINPKPQAAGGNAVAK